MSYMIDKMNSFVRGNIKLKSVLENFSKKISDSDSKIWFIVSGLEEQVKTCLVSKGGDRQVKQNLKNIYENFCSTVKSWRDGIESARKGIKFIDDFEKQSIVTVFGKVKCGKSYLGNFIMGNGIRGVIKSEYDKTEKPKVKIYDRGTTRDVDKFEELEAGEEFGVKSTEATSVIQWFFMEGMAWFDTPGIGSVTIENEMLAKEYVRNSDLVIYISNSDAAGTRQDFQELAELTGMGKPVLLLVSMSDTYEEDEDQNGNLARTLRPKSPKDRKDVEDYLNGEIKNSGISSVLEHGSILTVSAKLALEAVSKNDEELFKSSNIDKFYEKLSSVMGEKAVEFKTANPKKRLNGLIEEIIVGNRSRKKENNEFDGIDSLIDRFKAEGALIETKIKEMKNLKEKILKKLRIECNPHISLILKKLAASIGENGDQVPAEEIEKNIFDIVCDNLCKILEKELGSQLEDFNTKSISLVTDKKFGIGSITNKTDKIAYTVNHVSRSERPPEGFFENVCNFFGKRYYSTSRRTSTEYVTFNIGTNEQDIFIEIMNKFNDFFGPQIDREISFIANGYYGSIQKTVNAIITELEGASRKLRKLKL